MNKMFLSAVFSYYVKLDVAMSWLGWLVAGISSRSSGFDIRSIHVGICGGSSGTGTVVLIVLRFYSDSLILRKRHSYSFIDH